MRPAVALAFLLLACGDSTSNAPQNTTPSTAPAPPAATPAAATTAPQLHIAPQSTTIVVINDGASERIVDQTDGELMEVSVVLRDGSGDPHDRPDDVNGCRCYCDNLQQCRDCEPPMPNPHPIAAGARAEFAWSGIMHRSQIVDRQYCAERYTPPAGEYTVVVCSQDHVCGSTDVRLPASAPIEVHLPATPPTRTSCDQITAAELARGRAYALSEATTRLSYQARERTPAPDCGPTLCVLESEFEERARTVAGCGHFLIPRGDVVESVLALPSNPLRFNTDVFQTRVIWR